MDGVIDNSDAASACHGADLVLSVNSAADALDALAQGLPGCAPGTIWADLNTAAPALKQAVHDAAGPSLRVVDVAIMAPVPHRGLDTPMTVSGPAAEGYAAAMRSHGATVDVIDGPVGAAATRKLIRSVFYKGLAAAAVEALAAAERGRPARVAQPPISPPTSSASTRRRSIGLSRGPTPTPNAACMRWKPPPNCLTRSGYRPA